MSLEKILLMGVALIVVGGLYVFSDSLTDKTSTITGDVATSQETFETNIGGWHWGD